jgi:dihydrolipoamide dehydrogenase
MLPQIVATEEKEVAQTLKSQFKKRGINIMTNAKIVGMDVSDGKVTATLESGETITVQKALVAVGRKPVTEGLGLDQLALEITEKGGIKVNEKMETSVPGVYAIGDVLGTVMLAHVASTQGKVAVANALGGNERFSYDAIPNCIFTRPEIASVGMKEAEATEAGHDVSTAKFQFSALGKAMILEDTTGFVKVVADKKTDNVLGVSMIGPGVTDIIHEVVLAIHAGITVEQVARMIHAHPTLPESIHEAIEGIHKQAIHTISR